MHGEPLPGVEPDYPMTAVLRKTTPQPTAPWVLPGNYSVTLTTGEKSFTQPLTVKMDPRVKATTADLVKQFELSKALAETRATLQPIGKSFESLVAELKKTKERTGENPIKEQVEALRKKMEGFADPAEVRVGAPPALHVLRKVEKLFGDLQEVDAVPTPQAQTAVADLQRDARSVAERWSAMTEAVAALNRRLEAAGIEKLKFP
jgi:hypothetical protein